MVTGDENVFGCCHTQLADISQRQNGILDFKRRPKFGLAHVRAALAAEAARARRERHPAP